MSRAAQGPRSTKGGARVVVGVVALVVLGGSAISALNWLGQPGYVGQVHHDEAVEAEIHQHLAAVEGELRAMPNPQGAVGGSVTVRRGCPTDSGAIVGQPAFIRLWEVSGERSGVVAHRLAVALAADGWTIDDGGPSYQLVLHRSVEEVSYRATVNWFDGFGDDPASVSLEVTVEGLIACTQGPR